MQAEIISRAHLTPDVISVWVKPKGIFVKPEPGQFYGIKIPEHNDLLLRRPISVADVHQHQLRFIFRIIGRGTEILARSEPGDWWDILGPLGKPAPIFRNRNILLCAGGVGAAPLYYLCRHLPRNNRVKVVIGARRSDQLILVHEFRKLVNAVLIATEDGSCGQQGKVTDVIARILPSLSEPVIYACGPRLMLVKLRQIASNIPVWGFLEERMGCGTGICYCCGIEDIYGNYLRVCKDGPVVLLNTVKL